MKKYSEKYLPGYDKVKNRDTSTFMYKGDDKIELAENMKIDLQGLVVTKSQSEERHFIKTITRVDFILVAGGGGGGDNGSFGGRPRGGGGGAGGVIAVQDHQIDLNVPYTIEIGAGGARNASGSNSKAFNYTALGGGNGAYIYVTSAGSGGSGGGGSRHGWNNQSIPPGSTLDSTQGNNGGSAVVKADGNQREDGGGGGGATQAGLTNQNAHGGPGGRGLQWLDNNYYGGGGGGGIWRDAYIENYSGVAPYGGAGGLGGGGTGRAHSGNALRTQSTAGTQFTGGGGGGGYGRSGGSGVLILRYPSYGSDPTFTGNFSITTSADGNYKFFQCESNGDLTFEGNSITFNNKNTNMSLKNTKVHTLKGKRIHDKGTGKKIKGNITNTASGLPLFNIKGLVNIDRVGNSKRISINKSTSINLNVDSVWKSWQDSHESSITEIESLKGHYCYNTKESGGGSSEYTNQLGRIAGGPHANLSSYKIYEDSTNNAEYGWGGTEDTAIMKNYYASILEGFLCDDITQFVAPQNSRTDKPKLNDFLQIKGTTLTDTTVISGINNNLAKLQRKNTTFFVQHTTKSCVSIVLPNPIDLTGKQIYQKGDVIKIFVRRSRVYTDTSTLETSFYHNPNLKFYNCLGSQLTFESLTQRGHGKNLFTNIILEGISHKLFTDFENYSVNDLYLHANKDSTLDIVGNTALPYNENFVIYSLLCTKNNNADLNNTWVLIST